MEINRKRRPWQPDPSKWQTQEDNKFYHTTQWRKLRASFITAHPICVECESKGLVVQATVVDHITSIRFGGSPTNEENLQSLCTSCHNSKSSKESKR